MLDWQTPDRLVIDFITLINTQTNVQRFNRTQQYSHKATIETNYVFDIKIHCD